MKPAAPPVALFNIERDIHKKVRNWLRQQTACDAPGPADLVQQYVDFSEWEYETKRANGYSEEDIREYPTFERLETMKSWIADGKPGSAV